MHAPARAIVRPIHAMWISTLAKALAKNVGVDAVPRTSRHAPASGFHRCCAEEPPLINVTPPGVAWSPCQDTLAQGHGP